MPPPAKFITDLTGCQRHLHAFLSSVVWNIADADEILQETNLALWQKADEFDPSRPFLPWAMAFAQMQVKAWLKRQKRVPIVFDDRLLEQMAYRPQAMSRPSPPSWPMIRLPADDFAG